MVDILMTFTVNLESEMEQLEQKELEMKEIESADYEKLLVIYLAQNDLINAKFLWKRIPVTIKEKSDCLKLIWEVGKCLMTNDFAGVYGKIDGQTWPIHVSPIMEQLRKDHQSRLIQLISKGYTKISLEDVIKTTGCSSQEEMIKLGQSVGWKTDVPFGFTIDKNVTIDEENSFSSNQEQLEKLTDYVSFLEN
ncbi:COP9 signalosome complex subunit 8-like [Panonychus citri]|uniref:COP9 signalosome complex subunit 8-like n=1 Tax=Panonychus citri TaxID=50023 RepID=UPI002308175F|nr:COP9 signalosome complex subunit 8-like [Panonychus citri]